MSSTTAALTASTAMPAAARPRRASASRAPSAAKPPPRRRRRALATSAPRSRATVGRAVARHAGQAAAAATTATIASRAPASGSEQRPARRLLVERLEQPSPAAPRTAIAPTAMPSRAGHRARPRRAPGVLAAIARAREADRPLHADGRQPALDVGRRGGRQHRRRRPEGDEREGDQQRDDDPGRRVDEHAHAAAGDEAHALDLGARGARLLQEHVDAAGVRGPDERLVDREAPLGLALEPRARDVHPRRRGEREGDVVRRHRDPHHAQRPQPPDLDLVAHADVPRVGHAALDHDLVRRARRRRARRRSRSRAGRGRRAPRCPSPTSRPGRSRRRR